MSLLAFVLLGAAIPPSLSAQASCFQTLHVDIDAAPGGNGASWASANPDLQAAIADAQVCQSETFQIWIAEGMYRPHASDRSASFILPNNIELIGGFAGSEASVAERPFPLRQVTLSGDLAGNDNNGGSNAENARQVVRVPASIHGILRDVVVSGGNDDLALSGSGVVADSLSAAFTMHGGAVTGNHSSDKGGGIFANGEVRLTEVTISSNSSAIGGGVYLGGTAGRILRGVSIVENTTTGPGGGLWLESGSVSISDSTVAQNSAGTRGGGLHLDGPSVLSNVEVLDNVAPRGGGGVYVGNNAILSLHNSLVARNTSIDPNFGEGAGIFNTNQITVTNSTFADNTAASSSAIHSIDPDYFALISNSIFWGNNPGNSQFLLGGGAVRTSIVQGSGGSGAWPAAGYGFDGGDNLDVDPLFLSASNYRLQANSPARNEGNDAFLPVDEFDLDGDGSLADAAPDLDGTPRIRDLGSDLGPYEFQGASPPGFVTLPVPCVIYDSALAAGGMAGPIDGGESRLVKVSGSLPAGTAQGASGTCIPATATAALVQLAAVSPVRAGNLLLSEAGVVPEGGVVNFAPNGLNNANAVTVPLAAAGTVDVSANGGAAGFGQPLAGVRMLVVGYHAPAGTQRYTPLVPCVVADSRASQSPTGGFAGPFGVGTAYPLVDVVGTFAPGQGGGGSDCGVPATAEAVMVNVVAVNSSGAAGRLAAGAAGSSPSLGGTPFAPIGLSNALVTVVPLNGGQTIEVDVHGTTGASTDIRLVVVGYLGAAGSSFVPVNPCAVFDTRPTPNPFNPFGAFAGIRKGGQTTTYRISGEFNRQGGKQDCGVPPGASGVLINLVGVNSVGPGNLQVFATGTIPTGGVLNFASLSPAMNNSNAVPVPLSPTGTLDVSVNGGPAGLGVDLTHVRGVVVGYYLD